MIRWSRRFGGRHPRAVRPSSSGLLIVTHPLDPSLRVLGAHANRLANTLAELEGRLGAHDEDLAHVLVAIRRLETRVDVSRGELASCDGSNVCELLATIRHDLRAQVSAAKGYAELIVEAHHEDQRPAPELLMQLIRESMALLPLVDALSEPGARPNKSKTPLFTTDAPLRVDYGPQYRDCTVLLVDDNDTNRALLSRRLTVAGLQIFGVRSGQEAFEFLRRHRIDLVLLDVRMPGMTGPEVLDYLKRDEALADIPVLVLSAVSEVETITQCIAAGAEDYLSTPFNPLVLHARVKASLDRKLMRDLDRARLHQLKATRQQLESAIESIEDGFAIFDENKRLVMANAKYRALYPASRHHHTLGAVLLADLRAGVYLRERRGRQRPPRDDADWQKLYLARHSAHEPFSQQLADGRWIEVHAQPMPAGGVVSIHKDITERKRAEDRLTYLALHDSLTGLGNRARLDLALMEATKDAPFAVLYMDLDGFKGVNDSLGHQEGDRMLQRVAEILRHRTRDEDVVTRLGGDEFVVLLRTADRAVVTEVAERLREDIQAASPEGAQVTASIGVARFPEDGRDTETLLAAADEAMYAAKKKRNITTFTWPPP